MLLRHTRNSLIFQVNQHRHQLKSMLRTTLHAFSAAIALFSVNNNVELA
jgi:hypothetical protein